MRDNMLFQMTSKIVLKTMNMLSTGYQHDIIIDNSTVQSSIRNLQIYAQHPQHAWDKKAYC